MRSFCEVEKSEISHQPCCSNQNLSVPAVRALLRIDDTQGGMEKALRNLTFDCVGCIGFEFQRFLLFSSMIFIPKIISKSQRPYDPTVVKRSGCPVVQVISMGGPPSIPSKSAVNIEKYVRMYI